jgi:agmatine deiminase
MSRTCRLSPLAVAMLFGVTTVGCGADAPRSLPNWATQDELDAQAQGVPEVERTTDAPPTGTLRLPAEYEPQRAVVVTYTTYEDMVDTIAVNAAAAGAEVWVIGGPSSLTGVPANRYKQVPLAYDSVWVRDYGPVGIDVATNTVSIVDTVYRHHAYRRADDAIPCGLASTFSMRCYRNELILDGGNLMSDGKGNLFVTKRLYEWNSSLTQDRVDQILKSYFGAQKIHVFDYAARSGQPADGTGHIDMFAKIIGECKVLVASTDDEPFVAPLDKAAAYFEKLECKPGKTYDVYRIPAWVQGGTWYTYTNALVVNDRVLVPGYTGADNDVARGIYNQARPDLKVVFVTSDESITAGGSVHCITKEIPQP